MHLYQPVNSPPEKGFSLIEFMIAIAISLVIMLAVSIAWQSGYKTQQAQSSVSRLNETVRFAMDLLSREIRLSGLINTTHASVVEQNFCFATAVGAGIAGINDPATIDPTTTGMSLAGATVAILNKSDAIRVRYYGEDTGTGTSASADCLGNTVPNGALVEDTLYVAADPGNFGEPALWCHTSNANALAPTQPMVAGVESLQILYGEDINADGITDHYVPWQLVLNKDSILSVKVSIIARSADATSAGVPAGKTYYHFGSPSSPYTDPTGGTPGTQFTDPGDKRLRLPQPLSTEIAVRNFSHCL
jgi:type IV pilus assembly protein PilW